MKLVILFSIIGSVILDCNNNEFCGGLCNDILIPTCRYCWNSYMVGSSCVESKTKIADCLVYLSEGTCSLCTPGYQLKGTSSCEKITIPECLAVTNNSCSVCTGKKPNANGVCESACDIPKCSACHSAGCRYCMKGYSLTPSGQCFKNAANNIYCTQVDSANQCELCDYGYHLDNKMCTEIPSLKISSVSVWSNNGSGLAGGGSSNNKMSALSQSTNNNNRKSTTRINNPTKPKPNPKKNTKKTNTPDAPDNPKSNQEKNKNGNTTSAFILSTSIFGLLVLFIN